MDFVKEVTEAIISAAYGPDAARNCSSDIPNSALAAHALKNSVAVSKGPPSPGIGPCWYVPSPLIETIVPILGSCTADSWT
jgi:hypothetical protein